MREGLRSGARVPRLPPPALFARKLGGSGNGDPAPPPLHPERFDHSRVASAVPRLPPSAVFARKLGRAPGLATPNPSPPQPKAPPQVPPASSSSSSTSRRRRRSPCRRSRNAEEEARDWAALPLEAISAVLSKLDHIDILMGPGQVCRSWRRAARDDPALWRRIDMCGHADLFNMVNLFGMSQAAVRRAKGQCEAFWGEYAADEDVLLFLGDQAPSLKSLRLISYYNIENEGFAESIKKFPLLEELELSLCSNIGETRVFEVVGRACPHLKRFRLSSTVLNIVQSPIWSCSALGIDSDSDDCVYGGPDYILDSDTYDDYYDPFRYLNGVYESELNAEDRMFLKEYKFVGCQISMESASATCPPLPGPTYQATDQTASHKEGNFRYTRPPKSSRVNTQHRFVSSASSRPPRSDWTDGCCSPRTGAAVTAEEIKAKVARLLSSKRKGKRIMVNEGADQPPASEAPSVGSALPTVTHDAPVCPYIQSQLADEHQVAPKQAQQPHHDHQKQELQAFWSSQLAEIKHTTEFKHHNLPLSRIKKIMKADSDVQRISGEAPVVFAKACEMFIKELTLRGWHHAQEDKRRTVRKNDISMALSRTEVFDFLVDISPPDKLIREFMGLPTMIAEQPIFPLRKTTEPLPPLPLIKDELMGAGIGLPKSKSMQYTVPQRNASDPLLLTPPVTVDKVTPHLHLRKVEPDLEYMASSPKKTQDSQVPLCTMDVDPSPLEDSPERDWSELPLDVLSSIFMKLGTIEILMGAGLVCRSWLMSAKTPELWRFVDMTRHKLVFSKGEDTMCAMAKVAIDRSDGKMESFWTQKFVTDELLDYIASRANSLKSIRLIGCTYIWTEALARFASKCPLLEEIECSHHKMPAGLFRYIGKVCPQLKRLRIHMQWFDSDQIMREMAMENRQNDEDEYEEPEESDEAWEARQNQDAFAIAESLHELRLLQMQGNSLTNKGVYAILKGCPHLEFLDISECYHIDVNAELRTRCAKLKHVWLPTRGNLRCPDLHVIGVNEGEDDGVTMHDLWLAEAESLRAEAAMDNDGSYGDNYWECDCSSPDEPWTNSRNMTSDGPRFYSVIHDYDDDL
ncbi:hypothetical protein EJB05_53087, partial [Eragrostis curvula]